MSKLTEIEQRLAKATPGPWRLTESGDPEIYDADNWCIVHQVCSGVGDEDDSGTRNGALLVNAPADLRFLLDRVNTLKIALRDIEELACFDHDEAGKIARAALGEQP